MTISNTRNDKYRYKVGVGSSDLTPLASIEAYLGNKLIPVVNISSGGTALLLTDEMLENYEIGDLIDASISIRERAFPMQLELKNVGEDGRANCSFLNAPPAFQSALKEFLGPKHLGASIQHNRTHTNIEEALELEDEAKAYEAYTGMNQTGVFVWMAEDRRLLKLLAVSRDLVLAWTPAAGTQTGKLSSQGNIHDIKWDRTIESTVFNYLADILLAWRNEKDDGDWIKALFETPAGVDSADAVKFPY